MKTKPIQQNTNSGWRNLRLGAIATLTSSKRVYLSDYVNIGIPFYRGKEISQLKRNENIDDLLYISNEAFRIFKAKYGAPKFDDILITAVGTLGNIYRVANNKPFYFKDGNLIWLRDIKESPAFVEYLLSFEKNKLLNSAIGSNQKALTIVALNKIKMSFPPLPEQNRIVSVLETWDKAIEKLMKKIEAKRRIKKGLMQNLLTGKIRMTGFNDSWQNTQMSEITSSIVSGKSNTKNEYGSFPIYGSTGIIGHKNKSDYFGNKILIARVGANAGTINRVSGNYCVSDNTLMVSYNSKVNLDFQYYYLIQKGLTKLVFGSGQPLITAGQLKKLKISYPSLIEQNCIVTVLEKWDKGIDILMNKLSLLKDQKKYLLNNLITGKMRTPINMANSPQLEFISTKV